MKKKVLIISIGLLAVVSMAQAVAIQSITATTAGTSFSSGTGILTMVGVGGINVEDITNNVVTYGNGSFSLNTTLALDTSSGGIASGNFTGGGFVYKDSTSAVLLSGSITSFSLAEFVNGSGTFVGTGSFTVTGGTLQTDFGTATGSMVDISFSIKPSTISNFSANFNGSSNMTVLPNPTIPEPTTIALLVPAIWALRNRRNNK
ncbi:MAG: hypothetical protein WCW64_08850 [Phycisphaerae bacterium]|jgi:hypothetical protein